MIDLLLVGVGLGVGLADTFGDHARVALVVAGIFAVLALHASAALQEITAKSTAHNVVELALHKFVPVHLVNFVLALPDGTLSSKTQVDRPAVLILLEEV